VEAYLEAPERVAALVLVAPAIFAPSKAAKEGGSGEQEGKMQEGSTNDDSSQNMCSRIWGGFLELCMRIAGSVLKMIAAVRDLLRSLYLKALVAFLRSSLGVMLVSLCSCLEIIANFFINLILTRRCCC
jgi:pimeloyl-ACP methyl ester carboxylesterase